jgi:hypothetical protein
MIVGLLENISFTGAEVGERVNFIIGAREGRFVLVGLLSCLFFVGAVVRGFLDGAEVFFTGAEEGLKVFFTGAEEGLKVFFTGAEEGLKVFFTGAEEGRFVVVGFLDCLFFVGIAVRGLLDGAEVLLFGDFVFLGASVGFVVGASVGTRGVV